MMLFYVDALKKLSYRWITTYKALRNDGRASMLFTLFNPRTYLGFCLKNFLIAFCNSFD